MAQLTLEEVKSKAMEDLDFFRELLENPKNALDTRGITLSPEDMETMKCLLKIGKIELNAKEFLAYMGVEDSKLKIPPKGAWA